MTNSSPNTPTDHAPETSVREPTLPTVTVNVVRPTDPVIGRVVSNELCTKGGTKAAGFVRHVAIDVSGTPLAGSFVSGQSFGVLPPGQDDKGRPHKLRLYSIASPTRGEDGAGNVLATTVKRVLDEHWETKRLFQGVCSNYLCDAQPGDEIRVTGPSGKRFVLPEDRASHDYVFFATGTGIAPFRGMIRDLLESDAGSRVTLVMGVPYATDLLYHDDLTDLAARHENFRYVTALSREIQEDLPRRLYVQDRIAADPEAAPGGDPERSLPAMLRNPRTLVYVCGLAGMELGIFRAIYETLGREDAAPLIAVDDEIAGDPDAWTRRMLNRQIKASRRIFLEVY
jgi:ferredoxin--NADP+ reductase